MPNHILTVINCDNKKEVLKFMKSKDNDFDFNNLVQQPKELSNVNSPVIILEGEELKKEIEETKKSKIFRGLPISREQSDEYLIKYGANNWYDWNIKNWGTKWNSYNHNLDKDDTIEFQTAWGHPTAIITRLSHQFPRTKFFVQYADEDIGSNCGQYIIKKGKMIEFEEGDGKFACDLWGYDWEEYNDDNL
jgi:hypothetical protein